MKTTAQLRYETSKVASPAKGKTTGNPLQLAAPEEEALQRKQNPLQLAAPEEELQMKQNPLQMAAPEEELQMKQNPLQMAAPEEELQMKQSPLQLAAPEEELQMKQNPLQLAAPEEELLQKKKSPFQLKGVEGSSIHPFQLAEVPAKENKTGLPDQLKTGIESLSGHALDDVKVHYNSAQPAQLNALAYAQGTDIHVGPGQEKHLPHEAWHVVQQMQGRVQPTMQMKEGVSINDDKGLENEADVMGAKAIQMKSVDMVTPAPLSLKKKQNGNSNSIQMYRSSKLLASKKASGLYAANTADGNSTYHITPGGIGADDEKYNNTGEQHRDFEYCAHVTWVRWNGNALTSGTNQPHMYYREIAPGSWQLLSNTDTTAQNTAFKETYGEPAYGAVVTKSRAKIDALAKFNVAPFVPDAEVPGFQKHLDGTEESVNLEEQLTEYREAVKKEAERKRQAASSIEELKKNLSTFNFIMEQWGVGDFKAKVTTIQKFLDTYGDNPRKIEKREQLLKEINDFTSLALTGDKPARAELTALKPKIATGIEVVNALVNELKAEMAEEAAENAKWIKRIKKSLFADGAETDFVFDHADDENVYYYEADNLEELQEYPIDGLRAA